MTMELQLSTCSFARYNTKLGVPVSTAVKPPRTWPWSETCKTVTPFGIFGKYTQLGPYRIAYEDRLNAKQLLLEQELGELQAKYPNQMLVLLCFCDVTKAQNWCHRRMAAEWIEQKYGISVPEWTQPRTFRNVGMPTVIQDSLFE